MKTRFFVSFLLIFTCVTQVRAGVKSGFDKEVATDMSALCSSYTFLDLYGSDKAIIPSGYDKVYTSGIFGMDNKYQIYRKDDIAVINFRGSTKKKESWMANMYSAMIPAKGVIHKQGGDFNYVFANHPQAAVHSGYALAIGFLSEDILAQISRFNQKGIYDWIITGHSQGGALANMLKAYLENLSSEQLASKNRFKVYSFAAPMVGNKEFMTEYNNWYAVSGYSFNIVNPKDPIPRFPLNYNDSNMVKESVASLFFDTDEFRLSEILTGAMANVFKEDLENLIYKMGNSLSEQISKEQGVVKMPPYTDDINYYELEKRIHIPPPDYPKVLKDSSVLQNDSIRQSLEDSYTGHLQNESLYHQESWGWHHKPYNYYVSMLKKYFPERYGRLEDKYLPENL